MILYNLDILPIEAILVVFFGVITQKLSLPIQGDVRKSSIASRKSYDVREEEGILMCSSEQ